MRKKNAQKNLGIINKELKNNTNLQYAWFFRPQVPILDVHSIC
jgi:hypothetical protein